MEYDTLISITFNTNNIDHHVIAFKNNGVKNNHLKDKKETAIGVAREHAKSYYETIKKQTRVHGRRNIAYRECYRTSVR